jgi:hypothetical protein
MEPGGEKLRRNVDGERLDEKMGSLVVEIETVCAG